MSTLVQNKQHTGLVEKQEGDGGISSTRRYCTQWSDFKLDNEDRLVKYMSKNIFYNCHTWIETPSLMKPGPGCPKRDGVS